MGLLATESKYVGSERDVGFVPADIAPANTNVPFLWNDSEPLGVGTNSESDEEAEAEAEEGAEEEEEEEAEEPEIALAPPQPTVPVAPTALTTARLGAKQTQQCLLATLGSLTEWVPMMPPLRIGTHAELAVWSTSAAYDLDRIQLLQSNTVCLMDFHNLFLRIAAVEIARESIPQAKKGKFYEDRWGERFKVLNDFNAGRRAAEHAAAAAVTQAGRPQPKPARR